MVVPITPPHQLLCWAKAPCVLFPLSVKLCHTFDNICHAISMFASFLICFSSAFFSWWRRQQPYVVKDSHYLWSSWVVCQLVNWASLGCALYKGLLTGSGLIRQHWSVKFHYQPKKKQVCLYGSSGWLSSWCQGGSSSDIYLFTCPMCLKKHLQTPTKKTPNETNKQIEPETKQLLEALQF